MFQVRQIDEMQALTELSKCVASPGVITAGTTVNVAAAVCTLGTALGGAGGTPATFTLGDQLEVFPSAGAAANGVIVSAAVSATPGTCTLSFLNPTGGSITPTAAASYTIVATRLQPGVF
jgi:hypothetical protein